MEKITYYIHIISLHCITFQLYRDARSPVQTEQAILIMGVEPGHFTSGNRLHFKHICGTVVCSIDVLFLYLFMEYSTLHGVS